ncbi:MAG: glycosyl hydrolase family 8 [Trueperaceae bacterium]
MKKMARVFSAITALFMLAACASLENSTSDLETTAGSELIQNGNFSSGQNNWSVYAKSGIDTTKAVDSYGRMCVWVNQATSSPWDVQLYQTGLNLENGKTYDLTFKVVTSNNVTANFTVKVGQNGSPYSSYSTTSQTVTGSSLVSKSLSFTMNKADSAAKLEFQLATSNTDEYYCFDDVSIKARDGSSGGDTGESDTDEGGTGTTTYPYGGTLVPNGVDANTVISDLYAKWKSERLAYAPEKGLQSGEILPTSNDQFNNGMVSEGIGYCMLLSVYNNDKTVFDGCWKFGKRNLNQYGLIPWLFDSNSQLADSNNATDGDLDAAFALIVAFKKGWGYEQDAKNLIDAILTHCVHSDNSLERGQANNPKNQINTSYISPGYFKVFADFTGNNRWLDVRDKNYSILETALDKSNVLLIPHEVDTNGDNNFNSSTQNYSSDAARQPWRWAMDYVWFGEQRAKNMMIEYNNFFESSKAGGLSNLCESYDRYGNKVGNWCGSQPGFIIGGAASAQLAENDTVNRTAAWNALTTSWTGNYYSFDLMLLGTILTAGKMYNPLQ